MTTLTQAHNEWARRAPDERFSSLADMYHAALDFQHYSNEAVLRTRDMRAVATNDGLVIEGPNGGVAKPTNWAFGQLARLAEAPAGYLASLPAPLAADCLNTGIQALDTDATSQVLFREGNGAHRVMRGATSEAYSRIWNRNVTSRLLDVEAAGTFRPAPAAFDGSRGLYLGDRDMFAFMVDSDRRIFETLPGGGLSRGFFCWNSEVGARSFGLMTFLYEYVCGNHRVWGCSDVKEVRIRHIGDVQGRAWGNIEAQLIAYANSSDADDVLKIERMRRYNLGTNKEEVLDAIFGLRSPVLGKRRIMTAIDLAETREAWYGNPRSAWAMGGAITEIARDLPHGNERAMLDQAAGKVMELAF